MVGTLTFREKQKRGALQKQRQDVFAWELQRQEKIAEQKAKKQEIWLEDVAQGLPSTTPEEIASIGQQNLFNVARKVHKEFSQISSVIDTVLGRDMLELTDKNGKFGSFLTEGAGHGRENERMIRRMKREYENIKKQMDEILEYWEFIINNRKLPQTKKIVKGLFHIRRTKKTPPREAYLSAKYNKIKVKRMLKKIDKEEILLLSFFHKIIENTRTF